MILHNINSKRKDSGFTIVELLVVIVVIGILAAITIVSYTGVTNKANLAQNKSNASAVMKAADAYFAENNSYPTAAYPLPGNLNAGTVKIPTNFTLINTIPAVGTPTAITYIQATTGYCIQYWDTVGNAKATLALVGSGAACL
jgi:type IV pilus assembly protein PilA